MHTQDTLVHRALERLGHRLALRGRGRWRVLVHVVVPAGRRRGTARRTASAQRLRRRVGVRVVNVRVVRVRNEPARPPVAIPVRALRTAPATLRARDRPRTSPSPPAAPCRPSCGTPCPHGSAGTYREHKTTTCNVSRRADEQTRSRADELTQHYGRARPCSTEGDELLTS